LASVSREHWRYGKWLFASAILAVGVPDLQTILLSALVNLKAAGALRALMNFILPLSQIATVLSIYSLPGLARKMKTYGAGLGLRQAIVFPAAIIVLAAVYLGLLVACGSMLEKLLYNGRMSQYLAYLPLLALAAFISAIGAGFTTLLRAAQNSQHQLFAGMSATVVGVVAAMLLLQKYGLEGAMISMILANAASTFWIVGTYWYMVHKRPASWSAAWAGFSSAQATDTKLSTAAASE
jgi:O-antigen/teichoic acid export membrane protein